MLCTLALYIRICSWWTLVKHGLYTVPFCRMHAVFSAPDSLFLTIDQEEVRMQCHNASWMYLLLPCPPLVNLQCKFYLFHCCEKFYWIRCVFCLSLSTQQHDDYGHYVGAVYVGSRQSHEGKVNSSPRHFGRCSVKVFHGSTCNRYHLSPCPKGDILKHGCTSCQLPNKLKLVWKQMLRHTFFYSKSSAFNTHCRVTAST